MPSCRKDGTNWTSCSFPFNSAQPFSLFCTIQTPVLFVFLVFSSKRISLSPVTSVSAIHRSFPSPHSCFTFPWGIILHIWHKDPEVNILNKPTSTLPLNVVTRLVLPSQSRQDASENSSFYHIPHSQLTSPLRCTSQVCPSPRSTNPDLAQGFIISQLD